MDWIGLVLTGGFRLGIAVGLQIGQEVLGIAPCLQTLTALLLGFKGGRHLGLARLLLRLCAGAGVVGVGAGGVQRSLGVCQGSIGLLQVLLMLENMGLCRLLILRQLLRLLQQQQPLVPTLGHVLQMGVGLTPRGVCLPLLLCMIALRLLELLLFF